MKLETWQMPLTEQILWVIPGFPLNDRVIKNPAISDRVTPTVLT